jgi:hypothetical protein
MNALTRVCIRKSDLENINKIRKEQIKEMLESIGYLIPQIKNVPQLSFLKTKTNWQNVLPFKT